MSNLLETVQAANSYLIPKGEDNQPCIEAFRQFSGIEPPEFADERLDATSEDGTFWKVKGIDVPGFLAAEWATVGLTGTDSIVEFNYRASRRIMAAQRIGPPMCRFSILAEPDMIDSVRAKLNEDQ